MDLIEFLREASKLKQVKRTGFIVEGVKNPESVAEHSFATSLLALVLGSQRKDIDVNKAIKMAIVHDLAESQIGDVLVDWKVEYHKKLGKEIPGKYHGITKEEKHELEMKAMQYLSTVENGKEILELWKEFEEGKTNEAVFVKSLDRMEMLLQAIDYENREGVDLTHWINEPRNHITDPEVRDAYKKILEHRGK